MIIILIITILTLLIFYPILRIYSICSREEKRWELIRKDKNTLKMNLELEVQSRDKNTPSELVNVKVSNAIAHAVIGRLQINDVVGIKGINHESGFFNINLNIKKLHIPIKYTTLLKKNLKN